MKKILFFILFVLVFTTQSFATQTDYISGTWKSKFPEMPTLIIVRNVNNIRVKIRSIYKNSKFDGVLIGTIYGTKFYSAHLMNKSFWFLSIDNHLCRVDNSELAFGGSFISQSKMVIDNGLLILKGRCKNKLFTKIIYLNAVWFKQ